MPRQTDATILIAADWAPIRAFDPVVRQDPDSVYGNILPLLRGADLRIVNCECALTRSTRSVWKSGAVFKGQPAHVRGLTTIPFDVACLANNHVLDYGVTGLGETLRVLGKNRIQTVGAGLTGRQAYAPLSVSVGGTPVHIVNFSEGEDLTASRSGPGVFGWDISRASDLVGRLKRRGGLVIAIGHCGLEYVPYPPPYVVAAFREIADAGADCVIGHHPHVPQGIEVRRGRPIFYSLGNFVFYQETNLLYRKTGFCVLLRLKRRRIAGLDLLPYRITPGGLRGLDQVEQQAFRAVMTRISKPFGTPAGPGRAWEACLAHYGRAGFVAEVTGILDRLTSEPEKAAAMFRNRITTMQHAELWKDALTRIMTGARRGVAREAAATVAEWFNASIDGTAGVPNR